MQATVCAAAAVAALAAASGFDNVQTVAYQAGYCSFRNGLHFGQNTGVAMDLTKKQENHDAL
jgi:hypothetical protein